MREGQQLIFSVTDNGSGFDSAYSDKLFKVFQRLHREEEFAGTGVGLATARRVIEHHDGWIEGDLQLGTGACFRFSLSVNDGALSPCEKRRR